MVKQICPTCKGRGNVTKQKRYTDDKGKTRTETVEEACPQCGWSGWADR